MAFCLDKLLMGAAGYGMAVGIEKLSELIQKAVSSARLPGQQIPPLLTTIEGKMRPGLSAIALTSNIISRLGEVGG